MLSLLSPSELQLLAVLSRIRRNGLPLNAEAISRITGIKIPDLIGSWPDVMPGLIAKGLLRATEVSGADYAFTVAGETLSILVKAENHLDLFFYEAFYERAETSAARARFCELAYGRNLSQHGMADMTQLEILVRLLRINCCRRGLELGCGNGMTAGYIAEAADMAITGVDIAVRAMERARRRAQGDPRLRFLAMDIDRLDFAPASFDAVIAIGQVMPHDSA